jgi:hypothetical protein
MELRFDRMVIEPDTVIPIEARVVDVPGYNVDRYGRILGKGHAVRDTITWMIPILWPIDLINLPRRGPRPTLKEETRLTLKVMDDLGIPQTDQQPWQRDPSGLIRRQPSAYQEDAPPPPAPEPVAQYQQPAPQPVYVQPPPPVVAMVEPPPPPRVYYYAPPPPPRSVIVIRNGYAYRMYVH